MFTEISPTGFEEVTDGFLIFFISENQYQLDNSQSKWPVNFSRNIGVVKVSKDLKSILTQGEKVVGGHFGYDSKWIQSEHSGIMWITDYKS